ncbi:MAG: hypothetical protein Q9181_005561 [Wetmoreana brouardii]
MQFAPLPLAERYSQFVNSFIATAVLQLRLLKVVPALTFVGHRLQLTETGNDPARVLGVNIDLPEIVTDIAAGDLDLEAGRASRDHQPSLAAQGNRRNPSGEEEGGASGNPNVALTIQ